MPRVPSFADAEALRQYERAIELWDVVPAADRSTDRDLADLYDAASAAALTVGDAARAVDLARREIELVDSAGEPDANRERRARARERLSLATSRMGDIATSIPWLKRQSPSTGRIRSRPVRRGSLCGLPAT